jgi:5'-3' exonuclease
VNVHLIDGTYELFRAYYGGPPSLDPTGREVGGVKTLIASMVSLLRDPRTTHVAVAFDTVIESFRNGLFDGYKTGDGIEPKLFAQFGPAELATEALGMVTWRMIDFEADDALATAAEICAKDERVEQVLLCSPDKDLAQCVTGTRVVMLDRLRRALIDEARVVEKFGVKPASIPDLLGLVGDTADGIPGIDGWGAKSAATVLAVYERIDAIPDDEAVWTPKVRGAARLAAALRERRTDANLYRNLAVLRRDVPLGIGVDSLEWKGPDREKLRALAAELGDPELATRVFSTFSDSPPPAG